MMTQEKALKVQKKKPVNKNSLKVKRTQRTKELLCIWSILIIPLINLCIFWVYGTIQSVPLAFEQRLRDGTTKFNLHNFKILLDLYKEVDSPIVEALKNTLTYWSIGFFFIMPLCFLMAFFLYKKVRWHKFYRMVFFFPSIISSVIIASFFKAMFSPGGHIPHLWGEIFGKEGIHFFQNSTYALPTLLFYYVYTSLTGSLLYWLSAYARLPEEIMEAGRIDGLTEMGEFRHIALPLILPFYATMALLNVTGILDAGGPAMLLTPNPQHGTWDLPYFLYQFTTGGRSGMSYEDQQGIAAAVGLVKGVLILPIAFIMNRFVNKIETVEY